MRYFYQKCCANVVHESAFPHNVFNIKYTALNKLAATQIISLFASLWQLHRTNFNGIQQRALGIKVGWNFQLRLFLKFGIILLLKLINNNWQCICVLCQKVGEIDPEIESLHPWINRYLRRLYQWCRILVKWLSGILTT